MHEQDPRIDPEKANVFTAGSPQQPYAQRSVKAILGFIFALFLVGAFIGWYFFTPTGNTSDVEKQYISEPAQLPQAEGNRYEKGTGRSGVYNFFHRMFGGIEDGLEDNPLSLNNVDHLDQFNLDSKSQGFIFLRLSQMEHAQDTKEEIMKLKDGYKNSIFDIVGSDVIGRKGEKSGEVHDIIVHRETGNAKIVIINDVDSRYERDLTAITFKTVLKQQEDGDILTTVTEDKIEDNPDFKYSSIDNTNYVSLRQLRGGQLIDFEGKVAGQIDAIIYENAKAQNIYFELRPILAEQGIKKFHLPFKEINIVDSADGYDVKLSKKQTLALAKTLFE